MPTYEPTFRLAHAKTSRVWHIVPTGHGRSYCGVRTYGGGAQVSLEEAVAHTSCPRCLKTHELLKQDAATARLVADGLGEEY